MTKLNASLIALCAAAGVGLSSMAWAETADLYFNESEGAREAIPTVEVSLSEAISAAQDEIGGHAIAAKFEPARGDYIYAVDVIDTMGESQVAFVDPNTGDVSLSDPFYGLKSGETESERQAEAP